MMETEDEIYPEINFKSMHDAIQLSISVINNNQSLITEKQVSFDILKQKSIELSKQISKSEKAFSKMNSDIYSEMDLFQQEIPKKILRINECENNLQYQLGQLDEEKNRLLNKLQELNNQFNKITEHVEKINIMSQSISLDPSKSKCAIDNINTEEITNEISQIYNDLYQISEDIENSKLNAFQYEAASIQAHTLYLREIEMFNQLKLQLYTAKCARSNRNQERIQSLDVEHTFMQDKSQQFQNLISTLKQKQQALQKIESKKDIELENLSSLISKQKEEKSKLKTKLKELILEINQTLLKKDKHRNKLKMLMDNNQDELERIQELKLQVQNSLQKERQSMINSNKAVQNLLLMQNDIENEEKKLEEESFKLDNIANKLKLKEEKHQHIYERSNEEKKRLQAILFEYKEKISNQEKLNYELSQFKPTIPYEPIQYQNPIEKELNDNLTEIENIKQKIIVLLENKRKKMKEKSDMLTKIAHNTSETVQLQKKKRNKYEKQYYSTSLKHHQALELNEQLISKIEEKQLKINQRKKHKDELSQILLRVISECEIHKIGDKYIVKVYKDDFEPSKRKKRLDHFIEKYKEIINKVSEMKFKVNLELQDQVFESILHEWEEFIEKEYETI